MSRYPDPNIGLNGAAPGSNPYAPANPEWKNPQSVTGSVPGYADQAGYYASPAGQQYPEQMGGQSGQAQAGVYPPMNGGAPQGYQPGMQSGTSIYPQNNDQAYGGQPYGQMQGQMPQGQMQAQQAANQQYGYMQAPQPTYDAVQNLSAQTESMSLGGAVPPGMGISQPPIPGMGMDGGMQQQVAAPVLPRPEFDSDSVFARLNDMDAKQISTSVSGTQPLQLDAYGRPMQTGVTQAQTWPPTVACPSHMFYPVSPRVTRMTTNAVPNSQALAKQYGLPLGIVVKPMEDAAQLPVVNFGTVVVRCKRCRSYVNFMCKFMEDGRKWSCSLCSQVNATPQEYVCPLDQNGHRIDVARRPELFCGSFEVEAPSAYMLRPPMPPVYIFVFEVTPTAINSGLLSAAVAGVRDSLELLPNSGRTRVGIITFDSTVHFYKFKGDKSAEPSVLVLPDKNDVFLPTLTDQLVVPLQESLDALKQLLDKLPGIHAANASTQAGGKETQSVFGAALLSAQACVDDTGGKMVCFLSTRPQIGPGQVKDRSDNTSLGTDRERALLSPDSAFYKQKAVDLTRAHISCDLIICPPTVGSFIDVATIAPLAKYTGGELYYNPSFVLARDGHLLVEALKRMLGRETGWEAVMRIRASKGIRCSTFHGRFFLKSTDLLDLPSVDPDKAFAVEFAYDESVLELKVFCVQIALLYTTSAGERRIRVHTNTYPVVSNLSDLFLYTDAAATSNLLARKAGEMLRDKRLEDVRKIALEPVLQSFSACRKSMQNPYGSKPTMPELLTPMQLYMHGLLKSPLFSRDAFSLFSFRMDDKNALLHHINIASVSLTSTMAYPLVLPLFPLDEYPEAGVYTEDENGVVGITLPPALPAARVSMQKNSALLIDDGITTLVWVGTDAIRPFTEALLGSSEADLYQVGVGCVYGDPDGAGGRIRAIIRNVRGLRRSGALLHVVPEGTNMQSRVEALMVEERTTSQISYPEFIKDIQNKVANRTVK